MSFAFHSRIPYARFPHSDFRVGDYGSTFWNPYRWEVGERAEMMARNAADHKLVTHARLLERMDRSYLELVQIKKILHAGIAESA